MKYTSNLIKEFKIFKMDKGEEDSCPDCGCAPDDDSCPDCGCAPDTNTCDDCGCDCGANDTPLEDEFDPKEYHECEEFEDNGECNCDCDVGEESEDEEDDGDFDGIIRSVQGANLVYKRQQPDGDFEELWIFNIGKDIKHSNTVKRAILSGTDIGPSQLSSEDGSQEMELYSIGNIQYLNLTGLPN